MFCAYPIWKLITCAITPWIVLHSVQLLFAIAITIAITITITVTVIVTVVVIVIIIFIIIIIMINNYSQASIK